MFAACIPNINVSFPVLTRQEFECLHNDETKDVVLVWVLFKHRAQMGFKLVSPDRTGRVLEMM